MCGYAKGKRRQRCLHFLFCDQSDRGLPEPSRRMREQGVDEAGLRREVAAQRLGPAILARDLVEQALELGDVTVDRLLEIAVGAVLAGDFVKRLLAGGRIEAL